MSEKGDIDPTLAAKMAARQVLPKRFYKAATIGCHGDAAFALLLDGRPAKTPAKRLLAFDSAALGQLVADEWNAQGDVIDPATMPTTRLANTAIDGVSDNAGAVRDDLCRYAGSDLICYRADGPETLIARQNDAWNPLIEQANGWGVRLLLAEGVIHVEQAVDSLLAARRLAEKADRMALAALHVLVTLTGSFVIAMALMRGEITAEKAWVAAHVDEDWQISQWGEDAEAAARRAARRADFDAAVAVLNAAA